MVMNLSSSKQQMRFPTTNAIATSSPFEPNSPGGRLSSACIQSYPQGHHTSHLLPVASPLHIMLKAVVENFQKEIQEKIKLDQVHLACRTQ